MAKGRGKTGCLRLLIGFRTGDTYGPKALYLARACVAETVGTLIYVYLSIMALQTEDLLTIALVTGTTMALLVISFGEISGAHMNPAVSLGVCLAGRLPLLFFPCYVIAQLSGSIVGAIAARITLQSQPAPITAEIAGNYTISMFVYIKGGTHHPKDGVDILPALLSEAIITAILMLTVLLSFVDRGHKSPLAPLGIGFAVMNGIIANYKSTCGSMNPARSFGPAVVSMAYFPDAWEKHYIYWAGPMMGSIGATVLYWIIFSSSENKEEYAMIPRGRYDDDDDITSVIAQNTHTQTDLMAPRQSSDESLL